MKIKKGLQLWNEAKEIIPGGSQLLSKRSEMFLPDHWPSYFKKAKGCEVWDLDGNKFIDMSTMGIGSCLLGYADQDVNRAVKSAIDNGSCSTLNCAEEVELAKLLVKLHPWAAKVRYTRSGGEAMAVAVRIARAHTKKDKIAFCGYHGWHDWYLAANLADDKNLDGHLLPGLEPAGVPRCLAGTSIPFGYNKIQELEDIISKNKDIGVIVMEPMRDHEPKDDFLLKVRNIANRIGAVLIFDEVTSGWRFALGGIHLKLRVNPDIAVFAKAMGNGFPMSAIIGKREVMESAQGTFISSTNWTERMGPVAALATIKKIIKDKVPEKIEKTGKYLIDNLMKISKKHSVGIKVSGQPALIHLSFQHGGQNLSLQTLFTQEMLKKGFLASSGIYVSCAFKKSHIDNYLKAVDGVFSVLKKAIDENKIDDLLEGPVIHEKFKRLT